MDESKIKSKKIECILGVFLLIPPILGVFAFVLCMFGVDSDIVRLQNLSGEWTYDFSREAGGGMSAAPVYLGLMAIAGVWLVKDSIQCFFIRKG